jgi:hypothetical protein
MYINLAETIQQLFFPADLVGIIVTNFGNPETREVA